jgi:hypothetical protein
VPSTGVAASAKFSRTRVRLRCAGNCRYGTSEFAASLDVVSNPSPICPDYRDRSCQPAVSRRLAKQAAAGMRRNSAFQYRDLEQYRRLEAGDIERLRTVATSADQNSPAHYMITSARRSASGKMNFHHLD